MRARFIGCGTALVTPFTSTGSIDDAALRRLVRRQVDAGIDFLVPCGTTGESPTLSFDEKRHVVSLVIDEVAGRVPVLAGAGGYDTREVIALATAFHGLGADGILSVTPYYNKPTPQGLVAHYQAIASAMPLPIVLYNVPGRAGTNIDVATLSKLAAIPGVVGVKEASGNMLQIAEVCARLPDDFLVLSGDDALALPVIAIGGRGVISVASNIVPGEMTALVAAANRGDFAGAQTIHKRLFDLMQVNFVESNPIPVKAALAMLGAVGEYYRLPMVAPQAATRERIAAVLRALDLSHMEVTQ